MNNVFLNNIKMFKFFRPAFKKYQIQSDPIVLMWQPRNEKDIIFEIQDSNYRWSDKLVNTLSDLAEELTLTAESPEFPQALLGGNPFTAIQTTFAFAGTCLESKQIFIGSVMNLIESGDALTPRNESNPLIKCLEKDCGYKFELEKNWYSEEEKKAKCPKCGNIIQIETK